MKNTDTAYHEAGHAAIAAVLGILGDDSKITITRKGYELGSVTLSKDGSNLAWRRWPKPYTRKAILCIYAGPAVSFALDPGLDLFKEGEWYEMDMLDAEELREWIDRTYTSLTDAPQSVRQQLVFQTRYWQESAALVKHHWLTIEHLARELMKRKTMTGKQVEAAIRKGFDLHLEEIRKQRKAVGSEKQNQSQEAQSN